MATTERSRPAGISAGTGALLAAWVTAGAVARLTGTPVVIALMAALFVAVLGDAIGGWLAVRRITVTSFAGPTVITAGAPTVVTIGVTIGVGPATLRHEAHVRLATAHGGVAEALVPVFAAQSGDAAELTTIPARFDDPGIVEQVRATIDACGPFGLVWWRRTTTVPTDPIHIAAQAEGPLVGVSRSTSPSDGFVATERGNHRGDVDGVRPWREGDAVGAVHWVSSMRAGELIVHDRAAATDERWLVDIDALTDSLDPPGDPGTSGTSGTSGEPGTAVGARVRWTLDEGLRRGHDVAVIADGAHHVVRSDDDAARWSAWTAQHGRREVPTHPSIWRREIRVGSTGHEPDTTVRAGARWAAAGASLASLATLVGALALSSILIVLLAVGVGVGAAVSLHLARRAERRPVWLHASISVVVMVALIAIAVDARDVDGILAVLRGPMPNLLILLVVLHGFEVVDRRTLRVHQAITFVVACYAAGLRIDEGLGWSLAVWSVAFFTSLLLTTRIPRQPARLPHDARPAGSTATAPAHPLAAARGIARPIVWVAAAVIATLGLLSVIPVPDGPARLGLPALSNNAPTVATPGALGGPDGSATTPSEPAGGDRGSIGNVSGYPGFSETLDTSIRGDLGNQVVMRVRAPEPAFWRGQTFTEFDGRTWTVSPDTGVRVDGPTIDVPRTLGDPTAPGDPLIQTYYLETDHPNVVFAAYRPSQVIFDGALWTRPDGALRSEVTLTRGSVYTVVSERVQVTAELLRAQGDLGEFFGDFGDVTGSTVVAPFLELPASTTARTIDLATGLRTPGESTYDTILAYQDWLAANTSYDLDAPVPPAGADAVDDFLFESQLGYCEQIASALVIMLRSQGVPARLSTGYIPGERDRVSGVWKVRASDAHAWVEVWFPQTGWEAFDPTASVPLAGDATTGTIGGDLIGATVSSLGAYWRQLAALAAIAIVVLATVRVALTVTYRRRRGRWGLLQDRFDALVDDPRSPVTNPTRADHLRERNDEGVARTADAVADTLDRVAFDPTWVDDEATFERTRAAVLTLEGRPR